MRHPTSVYPPVNESAPLNQHQYPKKVFQTDRNMNIENSQDFDSPMNQRTINATAKAAPASSAAQVLPDREVFVQSPARNIYPNQATMSEHDPSTFSPPRTDLPFTLASRSPLGTLGIYGNLDTPSPPKRAEHLINRRTRFEREMESICAEAENVERERSQSRSKKASALEGVDDDDKYVGPWVLGRVVGKGASGEPFYSNSSKQKLCNADRNFVRSSSTRKIKMVSCLCCYQDRAECQYQRHGR